MEEEQHKMGGNSHASDSGSRERTTGRNGGEREGGRERSVVWRPTLFGEVELRADAPPAL